MHPEPAHPMRKARAVALRSMMEWSRGRLRTRPTNASGEIIDEMELHAGTMKRSSPRGWRGGRARPGAIDMWRL